MREVAPTATWAFFGGDDPTPACRVCGGSFDGGDVASGEGPYRTRWRSCMSCGSWSVAAVPIPERLDAFYAEYVRHLRASCVNKEANDGRRYTPAWRATREREYRMGVADAGLVLVPGATVVDYGAQDGLFLDVCRALEPALAATIAVDYATTGLAGMEERGHRFEEMRTWLSGTGPVDVVTLWDVYEHVVDLDRLLGALRTRLRRGGQLLVQTPRASLHAAILGPLWHHFLPVQHLQLPSREGLLRQMDAAGFAVERVCSFGANAPGSIIPEPYKRLFDALAKHGDLGSTQLLRFTRR